MCRGNSRRDFRDSSVLVQPLVTRPWPASTCVVGALGEASADRGAPTVVSDHSLSLNFVPKFGPLSPNYPSIPYYNVYDLVNKDVIIIIIISMIY